ncbi:MAG: hypothetical protein IPM39_29335 [Chloroflexi bacterium]|nr:hypothetical protein [Chloroflexota bacterium]
MSGNVIWVLAVVITAVANLSKIVRLRSGARLVGFSNLEAFQRRVGMVSAVKWLIHATFALNSRRADQPGEAFSVVVFMVIAATLVTPPMLRAAFAIAQRARNGQSLWVRTSALRKMLALEWR